MITPREAYSITLDCPDRAFNGMNDFYESIIAESGWYSYVYSKNVLNGRFELGEYSIDEHLIRKYMSNIKNKTSFYYKFI